MTTVYASSGVARPILPISPLQVGGIRLNDVIVRAAKIYRSSFQHDKAVITLTVPSLNASSDYLNKPIFFSYGQAPLLGYFYGYVNLVGKPQPFQKSVNIDISCLGFSTTMRSSQRRMLRNITSPDAMALLAKEHHFGVSFPPHWFSHKRMAQTNTTDWEFAVRVARMTGGFLYPMDGVLYVSHPIKDMEKALPAAYFRKTINILDPSNRSLMDFTPADEYQTVRDFLAPEFTYFTSDKKVQSHSASDTDPNPKDRYFLNEYIYSSDFGRLVIEASEVQHHLSQRATARIRGDGSVFPGQTLAFETGITPVSTDSFDGIWYCSEVQHEISEKVFQTSLGLTRDKYRRPKQLPYATFYDESGRGRPTMSLSPSTGEWVSSWQ